MRIAFITNNYTPYAAGVVKSIDTFTQQLINVGHDVIIIAPQFLPEHNDPAHVRRINSLFRFMYKQKHMAWPRFAKSQLKKYLYDFKPDVIHVHHPFLLGAMGARLAREMEVPVYFTYHTIYEDYAHYIPLPTWLVRPVITKKVLNFCKKVDHIIVPSSGIQRYLAMRNITHTSILPSPLRVDFCDVPALKKQMRDPINLLCVTRFTKEKNVDLLFEVMRKLPLSYHLTLVGYGDQERALREQAKKFSGRITFIIDPTVKALLQLYDRAHLFLFPSQTDTQGIVLAESMARGVPVIGLDGLGQRDIIGNGENGFIVKNSDQMIEAIEYTLSDYARYNRLCQHAQNSADLYRADRLAAQLVLLYKTHESKLCF